MNDAHAALADATLRGQVAGVMNVPPTDAAAASARKSRRERVLQPASVETLRRFGLNLRSRREALGLTQDRVAALAGLDQKAVSDVEVGARNATLDLMQRLAQAVGCTVSLLLACPAD